MIVLAMLALGMALFVAVAVSREASEPDLVRATDDPVPTAQQPLPQPVVPAAIQAPVAPPPAAPVSAPGMQAAVTGQVPLSSNSLASLSAVPGEVDKKDVVISPADGVYVGAAASQGVDEAAAIDSPGATPGVGMSNAELSEWRRGNAESMRVLEHTTAEVAGADQAAPGAVQRTPTPAGSLTP